jgi:tetratricopeptide (TPR) repeat protein
MAVLVDPNVRTRLELSSAEDVSFTAPDILDRRPPTKEADYYSAGVLLYWLHARRYPFSDTNIENLVTKCRYATHHSLQELGDTPAVLSQIVDGLLHKTPAPRAKAFNELLEYMEIETRPPSRVPMVGRRPVLDLLKSQLGSQNRANILQVTLIQGAGGVGKSRLIDELIFRLGLQGIEVFAVQVGHGLDGPCQFIQLLRAILLKRTLTHRSSKAKELGSFSATLLPWLDGNPDSRSGLILPERVIHDVVGWLQRVARRQTLRLCIDNLEEADSSTLLILRLLCCRSSELNVRIVIVCRDTSCLPFVTEVEKWLGCNFVRVCLTDLTLSEAGTLARRLTQGSSQFAQILRNADGNPARFFDCDRQGIRPDAQTVGLSERIRRSLGLDYLRLARTLAVHKYAARPEILAQCLEMNRETLVEHLGLLHRIGVVRETKAGYALSRQSFETAIESEMSTLTRRHINKKLYQSLRVVNTDLTQLAEHALRGCVWNDALEIYLMLTRTALKQGQNTYALNLYSKLFYCAGKAKKELPVEDQVAFADCLARSGQHQTAERLYKRLLEDSQRCTDSDSRILLASRFARLGRASQERTMLVKNAIALAENAAEPLSLLYARLSTSLVVRGDLVAANEALDRGKRSLGDNPNQRAEQGIRAASAFLLMNRGCFPEALAAFRCLSFVEPNTTAAVLTNSAVCCEHLGRLRSAYAMQVKAYRFAEESGHFLGKMTCLANLGTFQSKLGNLKRARKHFDEGRALMVKPPVGTDTFVGLDSEEASLDLLEANYQDAWSHMSHALESSTLFESERLELNLRICDARAMFGEADLSLASMNDIAKSVSRSGSALHAVQWALVRSRFEKNCTAAQVMLLQSLEIARKAHLFYEVCRLGIEYTRRSLQTGSLADPILEEVATIARRHGYKPLQAHAAMFKALGISSPGKRRGALVESFMLATQIGLPELIAENAYHMGMSLAEAGQLASSREWLLKSFADTKRIATRMPKQFLCTYENVPWRVRLCKRVDAITENNPLIMRIDAVSVAMERQRSYLRALYRASDIARTAPTVRAFLTDFVPVLNFSSIHSVVLLFVDGEETLWHRTGKSPTNGIKARILDLLNHTATTDLTVKHYAHDAYPIAWIPFFDSAYRGGLYITVRPECLREDDIEFFATLGKIIRASLAQIRDSCTPAVGQTKSEFCDLIGKSPTFQHLCGQIAAAARHNATVLIEGETGSGKELAARAIHRLGPRRDKRFVPVDCGAIPEGLVESELFGARRGSFTGATTNKTGLIEAANGGTLFLDEVSNLSIASQAKLLRVLQERKVRRVGDTVERPVDVRFVAASNVNLSALVTQGRFREDLMFRLNTLTIRMPPLRERQEDIPLLAAHFLFNLNTAYKTKKYFGPSVLESFRHCRFPGNVRQLQSAIEQSFVSTAGTTITSIPLNIERGSTHNDVHVWFQELSDGVRDFWSSIYVSFRQRDISREELTLLVDLGLRATCGSYRKLALRFHMAGNDYRRLMDFLRRNGCLLDFRPYRRTVIAVP